MKKYIACIFFALFLISCSAKNTANKKIEIDANNMNLSQDFTISPAPTAFQDVDRIMKSPGYWISKLPDPDKVILNKKEIEAINAKTLGKTVYLNNIETFKTKYYRKNAASMHKHMINIFAKYYNKTSNEPVGKDYFNDIEENIDYEMFSLTVDVKFAMTVAYAELRALPTQEPMFSSLSTLDLDRMQITQLDLASPLAILYSTKDKEWFYVVSEIAEGWIQRDSIAFCSQALIKDYKSWDRNIVTISPNTDIYKDMKLTEFFDYVKMGTVLPIANIHDDIAEIRIPIAKNPDQVLGFQKAYVNLSDISIGYMKYTQRNIIQQAFKHLNSPYGWGGMNGEQDCSSFLRQIFACFGIVFPRNSTGQIKNGVLAGSFNKADSDEIRTNRIIKNALPGMTLLYFPGHIMLYIGHENNKPYIIHSIWGYDDDQEKSLKTTYLINRVAVTSMDIGDTSKKGSLLQRVTLMKTIK